jgi:quercetin dioxygenase-like cupin family protein
VRCGQPQRKVGRAAWNALAAKQPAKFELVVNLFLRVPSDNRSDNMWLGGRSSDRRTGAMMDERSPQGYVLGATGGEHLLHFRDLGNILIKVDPLAGSGNLALGTQQVPVGAGIPIHRHFEMDEAIHVLDGSGSCTLNDVRHPFEKGGTIFIPRNVWHGFANPDEELLLLWIVAPTGLEGLFRATCSPPGVARQQLNRVEVNEIARKYATEFR